MPQTFLDAVIITRGLGIRHLWIDSLCIIQDSPEDWKTESFLMGKVYKYGMVNIAANIGYGCHDGIFARRDNWSSPVELPLTSTKQKISGRMYVRLGRWDYIRPSILGKESTLSSRGWVLQESILSPRTLHYSQQQMLWECEHLTYAESTIMPVAKKQQTSGMLAHRLESDKMILPTFLLGSECDESNRAAIYFSWMLLVQNYTARSLTYPSDIFAALGGVAAEFQAQLGDRYLAGLFEGDLLVSLLWRSVNSVSGKRISPVSAPSWSWASIIGPIDPDIAVNSNRVAPKLVGDCTAKILEAEITRKDGSTATADDFTDIKSGRLVVEGQLFQQSDDISDLCYLREDAQNFPVQSKTISNFEVYRQGKRHFDTEEDSVENLNKPIAILHIGIWEWWWHGLPGTGTSRFDRKFAGLLLRDLDDTGSGRYERIGMVTKEVGFHNVTVDSMFQPEDEHFLKMGWDRKTIEIV